MKIVILEANSLGKDVDLTAFEKLGEVTVYEQSNSLDTPEKIKEAEIDKRFVNDDLDLCVRNIINYVNSMS